MGELVHFRRIAILLTTVAIFAAPTAAFPSSAAPALWVKDGRLTPQAGRLIDAMRHAEDFGLTSADLAALLAPIDAKSSGAAPGDLDGLVSAAASRFVRQIHQGRVLPSEAGHELQRKRQPLDVPQALREIAAAPDVLVALERLEPRAAQFRALKQALARYRRLPAEFFSLPALPHRHLDAGDAYAGAEPLKRLLTALGDLPMAPPDQRPAEIYDANLAAAVMRFQRRHGLTPDGVLGARTYAALTTPLAHRVRQIELTLERWRWMPDLPAPAVIVNVPQFMLYALPRPASRAVTDGPLEIPVIVGESAKQTPIFDSSIEAVIFRPYWNVPASIVREEMLPLIRRRPDYFARHELEIVRGAGDDARVLPTDDASLALLRAGKARLRQRPGESNALGLIKFVLPNAYSVYLHSTPEAQLFARDRRALSHGCIRVSDASALAAYLLEDTPGNWDIGAIEAATCGTETFTVRLATPVPVFIVYGTAVVDRNGELLFFEDVYGHDHRLDALLRRGA